jgi:hypothetical protein
MKLALEAGFEPAPCRSRAGCSTPELLQVKIQSIKTIFASGNERFKVNRMADPNVNECLGFIFLISFKSRLQPS